MFGNETSLISSPKDLIGITNATDVISVDYYDSSKRVAVALGTKSINGIYDHTKAICDRLNNSSLEDIREVTLNLLNIKNAPFIVLANGERINNCFDIATYICSITGQKDNLIGLESKSIEKHLSFFSDLENSINRLELLNDLLEFNSFCNDYHITVSDLFAIALVMKDLSKMKDEDKVKFSNVFRWALHLQSLDGLSEQLSKLKFNISPPVKFFFLSEEEDKKTKDKKENKGDKKEKKDKKENKDNKDDKENKENLESKDSNTKVTEKNQENKNDKKDKVTEKKEKKEEKTDKVKEKKPKGK